LLSKTTDAIAALLAGNELPVSDVTPNLMRDFAVAEDAHSVIGSVGLQRFEADALPRPLAVARPERRARIGRNLLAHAEDIALSSGIAELWLRTRTAAEFFWRAGYAPVASPSAPGEFRPARSSRSFGQALLSA
jgi:N-acetylglutamate synthase-like GNAT family acetyltransferase